MGKQIRYFEDYQLGQKGVTATRTVTEADVVNFACITADYKGAHMDRHYMRSSIYGERVAHGLLGSSLATGMLSLSAPHTLGRGVPRAYFSNLDANYRKEIKIGDTIKIEWRVAEKINDPTQEGFGLVKTAFEIVNQDRYPVYNGAITIKVKKKSAGKTELQLSPGVPWKVTKYVPDPQKVYYAEDYPVGKGGETDGRTITETDVVNFAGLTGDYNPQHVDAEFAKGSIFGERIAHGMLVFTLAFGLWVREWKKYQWPETKFAGHLNDKVSFLLPVKIGDTIRCRYKTIASRVSRSKPDIGLVTFGLQVVNQRAEVVQEGTAIAMIAARTATQSSA